MSQEQEILIVPGVKTNQLMHIMEHIYPIGTCYETVDENFNPNAVFAGSWVFDKIVETTPKNVYRWIRINATIEDVHGRWVDSGLRVNDKIVYQSNDSWNINNAWDMVKVTFKGRTSIDVYIRSFAEGNYDYIMVSEINNDFLANCTTTFQMRQVYSNTQYVKAYTRGKQSATNYEKVTFDNLDPDVEYFFYIVYQKDASTHRDDDRGYFYIEW